MRSRWPVAVGVVLLGVGVAGAQPQLPPVPPPALPPIPGGSQLPPLLPAPPPTTPLPEVPRPGAGPGVEYDPGYLYLPERAPERARRRAEDCGPAGRWWFAPTFELAWVPTNRPSSDVRLRLPDGAGGSIPGPVLPVAGRSSGRFDAALGLVFGRWFGETNNHGVEAGFYFRNADHTFGTISPGTLVLFPQGPGRGVPQVIPFPDPFAQQVVGAFPSTLSTFYATVDVNYRHKLYCTDNARLDVLAGYRFAYLQDELYLGEVPNGNDDYKRNRASVSNPFHGGQIGLAGEYRADGWYVAGSAKVAFGVVTPEVATSGLFVGAQGRINGGRFTRLGALSWAEQSEFAVMPTANVTVGRQVSEHSRVFAGYSFQYLSRVARLGDALDARNPALTFTDFWVQSVNVGFEWRY